MNGDLTATDCDTAREFLCETPGGRNKQQTHKQERSINDTIQCGSSNSKLDPCENYIRTQDNVL